MIGNAVPVVMAKTLASKIIDDLSRVDDRLKVNHKRWEQVSNMIEHHNDHDILETA
jgi:hypothetical protein